MINAIINNFTNAEALFVALSDIAFYLTNLNWCDAEIKSIKNDIAVFCNNVAQSEDFESLVVLLPDGGISRLAIIVEEGIRSVEVVEMNSSAKVIERFNTL